MVKNTKCNPLELPLSKKTVNQQKYSIPGEIAEIIVTEDMKDAGIVDPITSSFNIPIWPVQKRILWKMTVDY